VDMPTSAAWRHKQHSTPWKHLLLSNNDLEFISIFLSTVHYAPSLAFGIAGYRIAGDAIERSGAFE